MEEENDDNDDMRTIQIYQIIVASLHHYYTIIPYHFSQFISRENRTRSQISQKRTCMHPHAEGEEAFTLDTLKVNSNIQMKT